MHRTCVRRASCRAASLLRPRPLAIVLFGLAAMAGGCAGTGPGGPEVFAVGGAVSGLSATLVLRNNGADDLTLSADGTFTFPTRLPPGSPYNVTVATQPTGQTCIVSSGSGTVGSAHVTNVLVTCMNGYAIGGTVSGLLGVGCVLQNNGSDDLAVTANGAFTFPTWLRAGNGYSATVRTQPRGPTQTCTLGNGSGIVSGPVTNILVDCSVNRPPCSTATYLGSVRGDEGSDVLTATGAGDAWFRVRVTEVSPTFPDIIGATVTLSPPSGIGYDIYVYCVACGGELGGFETAAGAPGTAAVGWDDRFLLNDDHDILIHVSYYAGSSGGDWTLRVRGHTYDSGLEVSRATCTGG